MIDAQRHLLTCSGVSKMVSARSLHPGWGGAGHHQSFLGILRGSGYGRGRCVGAGRSILAI